MVDLYERVRGEGDWAWGHGRAVGRRGDAADSRARVGERDGHGEDLGLARSRAECAARPWGWSRSRTKHAGPRDA